MFYRKNKLIIEKVPVHKIARQFGTPIYCYSFNQLKRNILNFKRNFTKIRPLICFAVKANNNYRILSEIGRLGLGADVVSRGELIVALKSKIHPKKIVFSGVGKRMMKLNSQREKIFLINAEFKVKLKQFLK